MSQMFNVHPIFGTFLYSPGSPRSHDDLPVLLVIGDFVGAPQLAKATPTDHKGDDSWDILGLGLLLVLVPLAVSGACWCCPTNGLALARKEWEVIVVQLVFDCILDDVFQLWCPP